MRAGSWGAPIVAGLLLLIAGCSPAGEAVRALPPAAAGAAPAEDTPAFEECGRRMGIRYRANRATRRPRDILETNGSGCAFVDYDGDGDLDVLLVGRPRCALYRNDGTRFTEVTARAGLDARGYWIGVGAADWDNDGDPDLCLTGYRCGRMLRNEGGRFRDVTARSGIRFPAWGQSVAFADVDRDGLLDLYLPAYARFGPGSVRYCRRGDHEAVCGPELYPPEVGRLFLNRGTRFVDVTRSSGLAEAHGRCWGAMFQDFDDDGRPDLYLANDMLPGDLFWNQSRRPGAAEFRNIGVASGTAYDANGNLQGGMGVDWGDFDRDGRPDLVVTTFSAQSTSLYRNDGGGMFTEVGYETGLAPPTLPYVGFGVRFLDYDNDGWLDCLHTNGHVEDNAELVRPGERYAQPILLMRNNHGRFENLSATLLRGVPNVVARGTAFGDFDNDGRIDVLVMDLEGNPLLLRNRARGGHWLGLRLIGTRSNRDGIGARVFVRSEGVLRRFECQTSGSVLSSNDPRLLIGLAAAGRAEEVTVRWPSGAVSRHRGLPGNRYVTLREP